MYQSLNRHIGPKVSRKDRIEELKKYFNWFLVEDAQDGSGFDHAVTDALDQVLKEYPEPVKGGK